eukprot:TRINITY_DN8119_c0_g1_i11.p3 TRINITY_DN8119_c0_g1~~TRINITY_DN8119_c0_g1_i11.p3  ORF type:complete len:141 (+),score=18.69 TRINITY_DN8119_c0_g1_i11:116-538(+)
MIQVESAAVSLSKSSPGLHTPKLLLSKSDLNAYFSPSNALQFHRLYKPNKDFIDYSFAATSCSDFECKHSVATNTDLALGSALLSSCQPQLELEHRGFPAYGIREQATQTVDGWKGKNGMGRKSTFEYRHHGRKEKCKDC